jgi:N-acetylglucosaminyldiphosphoundecaprenol N-acetyl-beta-D-mannosaminyltransferase
MNSKKTVNILNTKINRITAKEVLRLIKNIINNKKQKKPFLIFTANVDHLILQKEDKEFKKAYQQADLIVADGMPLVWASYLLKKPLSERVNGTNLTLEILKTAEKNKWKTAFIGHNKKAVEKAFKKLKSKFKHLKINTFSTNKQTDILFSCLGAPKQEKWLVKNQEKLNTKVAIGIGSAIDFLAEDKKRAPVFLQKLGLEWLFRLLQEPKRLWKRYLLRDIKFPFLILKQIIFKK